MQFRKLTDLTHEEIKFIVNDIFKPKEIKNIVMDEENECITVTITLEWDDGDSVSLIDDDVDFYYENISADFSLTYKDKANWKKFLLAKGCNKLLDDNKYLV